MSDVVANRATRGIGVGLVVPVFEETGWTGFAIPHLRERHGIATTGLIVGLLWGAWHFPLFAASANASGPIPSALYLGVLLFAWLPPYRILMVWVYDNTKSVLLALLMHVPIVVGGLALIPMKPPEVGFVFDLVFGAALWVLVAAGSKVELRARATENENAELAKAGSAFCVASI